MYPSNPTLFDEQAADQAVINSLLGEIKRLTKEKTMSKIVKTTDGSYYVVHEYEELSPEAAQKLLADLRSDVAILEEVVASAPAPAAPQLTDPNAAAPATDQAAPSVPAPAPAAPAVNPADAGGVPTTPPPAVDPNAPAPVLPPAPAAAPSDGTGAVPAPQIQ